MSVRRLLADPTGASAAEFGLVLPLLITVLFGVIDAGRYMWDINRAEKGAQMGVRMAIVTDPVSSAIDADYVGKCSPVLNAGDPIPSTCFSTITCSKTGASATCTTGTANTTAFDRVVTRIRAFAPAVAANQVQIIYSPSGLGYAGNPSGPDLAPVVTVRLSGVNFAPITLFRLKTITLPEVRSSLTFEDGIGSNSN